MLEVPVGLPLDPPPLPPALGPGPRIFLSAGIVAAPVGIPLVVPVDELPAGLFLYAGIFVMLLISVSARPGRAAPPKYGTMEAVDEWAA